MQARKRFFEAMTLKEGLMFHAQGHVPGRASRRAASPTAGVVAAHAEEITKVFYPAMFAAHPELLRVFNRANQAVGEQPKALAASVVAFAVQLIDPAAPDFGPVLRRIAHKHVSLGIQARSYLIVGHHLLDAVGTHFLRR